MISEDRLRNWGRYVRLGRFRKGHCMSIEHRTLPWYSPPQAAQINWLFSKGFIDERERIKMFEDIPKPRPAVVDASDADLIESGWRYMRDEKAKKAMKWKYVKLWTNLMLQRQLREGDIDNFIAFSIIKLSESVDKVSALALVGRYPTYDNSIRHRVNDLPIAA